MAKSKYILSILATVMTLAASAGAYHTLTFVKTDGTTISFAVDGLIITYDDFAHAVITNNVTTATIDLADLDCMYFSNGTASLKGDVNGDGEVNIADINTVIDLILSGATDIRADVNADGEVNIADINAIIDIILT